MKKLRLYKATVNLVVEIQDKEVKADNNYFLTADSEDEAISIITLFIQKKYDKIVSIHLNVSAASFPLPPTLIQKIR